MVKLIVVKAYFSHNPWLGSTILSTLSLAPCWTSGFVEFSAAKELRSDLVSLFLHPTHLLINATQLIIFLSRFCHRCSFPSLIITIKSSIPVAISRLLLLIIAEFTRWCRSSNVVRINSLATLAHGCLCGLYVSLTVCVCVSVRAREPYIQNKWRQINSTS